MDLVTDIEIERVLRHNEKILVSYLGKNRKQIKDYIMNHPPQKRFGILKDLIKVAELHKKSDPDA